MVLHNILSEMEEVTELQPVSDAHVPVMKFKFLGISIDLLYASIYLLVVPEVSLECGSELVFSLSLSIKVLCINFLSSCFMSIFKRQLNDMLLRCFFCKLGLPEFW